MIGKTILHYKIKKELGRGGMGVVYQAEDTRLERQVALKFLPPHLGTDEEEKQRFVQEAKAASALDNPNICTIFEIGKTEDGQMYMAMAYYEGETLKQRIDRGPLPIEEAIDIALQIASGLARAHQKDIVHRDVKPANIIITHDGAVKILDFGLAKLGGQSKLTKAGTTLGTTAYMSPEQAQAQKVDRRTDVFSLGVVLYEMITGKLPFQGEYEQATIYAILNETQEPLTGLRSGVPMELERIVNKCLQKDPGARYQHLDELMVDLKQLKQDSERKELLSGSHVQPALQPKKRSPLLYAAAGVILLLLVAAAYFLLSGKGEQGTNGARIPIAVADFTNQTGEAELDGLSGMLITALEQSRRLSVLSRARMFDILGQMGKTNVNRIDEATGREISLQAGVNALVTASIRKLGRKYIIDMKVLDPRKNEYLLTAREDGEGQESILAMIDGLSEKTRKGLKEQASEIQQSTKKVADVTTTNLQAYQHFFQGEQFINKLKWHDAITEFKKAIALDSTFGLAYFRLGYSLSWNGTPGAEEAINKALQYIDRVPEKEQYMIRGEKEDTRRNLPAALIIYKEGLRKYPDEKEIIYIVGDLSFHLAQYDSAIYYLKKVLAMDPRFERAWQHLSWTYREIEPVKFLETARQYLANVPTEGAYINLGHAYEANRQLDMGLQTYEKARELFPESIGTVEGIAGNYIMRGEFAAARSELRKLIAGDEPPGRLEAGYRSLVVLSAYQGQFKQAFSHIESLIQKNQQENNRANLAHAYATKAFWLAFGRGDFDGARKAVQTAGNYLDAATMTTYVGLFYACARTGNFNEIFYKAKQETNLFPFRDLVTEGYKNMDAGNCRQAIDNFQNLIEKGGDKTPSRYFLAKCAFELGVYDRAIAALEEIDSIPFSLGFDANYVGEVSVFYPKKLYLLGKVYQATNNHPQAMENYKKFLELWKEADRNLPQVIDANKQLAVLKARGV